MIIVIEPQMQGEKHTMINQGFLRILLGCFTDDNLLFISDHIHSSKIINESLELKRITTKTFHYNEQENKNSGILIKILRQLFLAIKYFFVARNLKVKLIIFTSSFPLNSIFLNYLAVLFNQKIIICQHGDLGILLSNKKNLLSKLFKKTVKMMICRRNVKYNTSLIYGESIKIKLLELNSQLTNTGFITIDHPYTYNNKNRIISKNKKILISNIGAANYHKSSETFFELANILSKYVEKSLVKFLQIGTIDKNIKLSSPSFVEIIKTGNDFIPFSVFEYYLNKSDYFIFFFQPGGYYELCPSGTFFDALKYQKPIIALKTSYFEYYFNQMGNIGYLANDLNEMVDILESIIKGEKSEDYEIQVQNIIIGRTMFENEVLTTKFKQQVYEILNPE